MNECRFGGAFSPVLTFGVILIVGCSGYSDQPIGQEIEDKLIPFTSAHFASTHNSYSGSIAGDRGSIIWQLNHGIRCLEFDVHDNEFETYGYRIGHDEPGDDVDHIEGNPSGAALADWLDLVAAWSAGHPGHAPITVYLDLRDNLTDNRSPGEGNLGHLNNELIRAFGSGLFEPDEMNGGSFPTIDELKGQVIVVLSGVRENRFQGGSFRDRGNQPAVAMNSFDQVIECHDNGKGDLWYWAGRLMPDDSIKWLWHEWYDTGQKPVVALNNAGYVIEVHEDQESNDNTLRYRMGRLDENFEILWYTDGGIPFPNEDEGVNPSVVFVKLDSLAIREVHLSRSDLAPCYRNGVFNVTGQRIDWVGHGETGENPYPRTTVTVGSTTVEVDAGPHPPFDNALLYRINTGPWSRIHYPRKAFVEFHMGDPEDYTSLGLWFFAAKADAGPSRAWAEGWMRDERLVRLYKFDPDSHASSTAVTYPSTDNPHSRSYLDYTDQIGCIE